MKINQLQADLRLLTLQRELIYKSIEQQDDVVTTGQLLDLERANVKIGRIQLEIELSLNSPKSLIKRILKN